MKQWDSSICQNTVKLTNDQQFLSNAMGVPIPFLPFATIEEKEKFGLCMVNSSFPRDDEGAAIKWCEYVDGVSIMPKLPVHIRNHKEKFERNKKVRQAVQNAQSGNDRLAQLNAALATPVNTAQVQRPGPMPPPEPQAMCEEQTVGRMSIGETQLCVPEGKRSRKGKPDKMKRKVQVCKYCERNQCSFEQVCKGRASNGSCQFFNCISINPFVDVLIPCKLCSKFNRNQPSCQVAKGIMNRKRKGFV